MAEPDPWAEASDGYIRTTECERCGDRTVVVKFSGSELCTKCRSPGRDRTKEVG